MDIVTTISIAFALAMDAFAVSVGVSALLPRITKRQYFRLSWHFGLFQALMPLIGWFLGSRVSAQAGAAGHWIAFGILLFLGFKMIQETLKRDKVECGTVDPTRGMTMVLLSVATSIDAFAAGLSLAMLGSDIVLPSVVIGLVACAMTLIGMHTGKWLGRWIGQSAGLFGGIVLISLGIKVLIEHGA